MVLINVICNGRSEKIEAEECSSLLETLRKNGFPLESDCSGAGLCKKCVVELIEGELFDACGSKAVPVRDNEYLACCVYPRHEVEISLKKQRIAEPFEGAGLFEKEICEDGDVGIAFDVGSTTIAGALADMKSQQCSAYFSDTNPQIKYGADVISRIAYSIRGGDSETGFVERTAELNSCLVQKLSEMISRLFLSEDKSFPIIVVGNTAIMHFFYNITPFSLASYPFEPEFRNQDPVKAVEAGIHSAGDGMLYTLPFIAGFVGSDTVAALLSIGEENMGAPFALIDFGTNSEIVIGDGKRILCCSAAAGPAFEGAHISSGMRAACGAVSSVRIGEGGFIWKTIGEAPPVGICGSGIIDLTACMLSCGLLNKNGRLCHKKEVALIGESESGTGKVIGMTQSDIRQLQLVKGSIKAAIEELMSIIGIGMSDIERFYVTGSFGFSLDIMSAVATGILPNIKQSTYIRLEDAALKGAIRALTGGKGEMEKAERISSMLEHIELSSKPGFAQRFTKSMDFEVWF